ncbi:MAG: insulinase family protein [Gammaproteobacteria bacterium]|nr:insulinase family protein [Gammaproteobacteria bacterium]
MIKKWITILLFIIPASAWAKPVLDIQYWHTANGAPVYFVPSDAVAMVDVAVIFNAGSAQDGNQFGLANLTNSMLAESTSNWDVDEIALRFAQVGAQFSNYAARDTAVASFRSLTDSKKLMSALDTFTEVLTDAQFPRDNFDRIRTQILVTLKGQEQDPDAIASNALMLAIYGNNPYGHNVLGDKKMVAALSRSDVSQFYHHYYTAQNASIVIVGDVDRTVAEVIAEHIINRLPAGKAIPVATATPAVGQVVSYSFPSTQRHIRFGAITINRSNPDYTALAVGNFILGNGFTSRLFKAVREQRGLSYDVNSSVLSLRADGLFMIGLETQNKTAKEAIKVTQDTLAQFIQQGPTAAELQAAKQSITGGFPLLFDSNSAIFSDVMLIATYQLPLDFFDTYKQRINNVTTEEIKAAWQNHIDLKQLSVVSVGG